MALLPSTAADIRKLEDGKGPDSWSQTITEPQQADDTDALEGASEAPGGIEKAAEQQVATGDVLDWDGPDDPENPQNWAPFKRRIQVLCIALYMLLA